MEAIFWLATVAVLILIEIITLGLTTIWFAGGGLVAFFVALLGGSLAIQITVFVVISLVLLFFTRPVAIKYFNTDRVKTNTGSLIGERAKVTETIDNDSQTGAVIINGLVWTARSENDEKIEAGTMVEIKEIKGVKAIVIKIREDE